MPRNNFTQAASDEENKPETKAKVIVAQNYNLPKTNGNVGGMKREQDHNGGKNAADTISSFPTKKEEEAEIEDLFQDDFHFEDDCSFQFNDEFDLSQSCLEVDGLENIDEKVEIVAEHRTHGNLPDEYQSLDFEEQLDEDVSNINAIDFNHRKGRKGKILNIFRDRQ